MEATETTLSIGILIASFLGSWHCAGMCGPIASFVSTQGKLSHYHLGRFISYILLGIIAGHLGNFFSTSGFIELQWIAAVFFSLTLLVMGFRQLVLPIDRFFQKKFLWAHRLKQFIASSQNFSIKHSPFVIGLLTAFLPCGWLYSYVLAAVASKSSYAGALIMTLFWLGGLPALLAIPSLIEKTLVRSSGKQKKIAGVILIAASFYSIISFYFLHSNHSI